MEEKKTSYVPLPFTGTEPFYIIIQASDTRHTSPISLADGRSI